MLTVFKKHQNFHLYHTVLTFGLNFIVLETSFSLDSPTYLIHLFSFRCNGNEKK